ALCKGKGCDESTGGMLTKLDAIKNAAHAGIECVIAAGKKKNALKDIIEGKNVGTRFKAKKRTLKARKRWIAFSLKAKGKIIIDKGAETAVVDRNKSLLPSGIKKVEGVFAEGSVVEIVSLKGSVIARGLSNYSSQEINKIKNKSSDEIEKELGYKDYDEVIHRDNLVVLESRN
ncbi:MAG: PUA domain-containing protein, partial [Candidatus Omnitrophota bacterium]